MREGDLAIGNLIIVVAKVGPTTLLDVLDGQDQEAIAAPAGTAVVLGSIVTGKVGKGALDGCLASGGLEGEAASRRVRAVVRDDVLRDGEAIRARAAILGAAPVKITSSPLCRMNVPDGDGMDKGQDMSKKED